MQSVVVREGAWWCPSGCSGDDTDDSAFLTPLPRAPLTTSVNLALGEMQTQHVLLSILVERSSQRLRGGENW
ncbi:unnamed protein product, partial [Rangifer tarandus platyrhynchus]